MSSDANILMNTNHTNNDKLIFPKLSYVLTGSCFEVHNELGRFAREKQYCNALEEKIKELELPYVREFIVKNTGNILDFVIDNKIILEIKAKRAILKEDYYQTQRYLQILNLKLGLLINFRNRYLKSIRVIKIDTDARSKFL